MGFEGHGGCPRVKDVSLFPTDKQTKVIYPKVSLNRADQRHPRFRLPRAEVAVELEMEPLWLSRATFPLLCPALWHLRLLFPYKKTVLSKAQHEAAQARGWGGVAEDGVVELCSLQFLLALLTYQHILKLTLQLNLQLLCFLYPWSLAEPRWGQSSLCLALGMPVRGERQVALSSSQGNVMGMAELPHQALLILTLLWTCLHLGHSQTRRTGWKSSAPFMNPHKIP